MLEKWLRLMLFVGLTFSFLSIEGCIRVHIVAQKNCVKAYRQTSLTTRRF